MTDKPVILEHHGTKEIMTEEMLEKIRKREITEICDKCKKYTCICKIKEDLGLD